MRVAIIGRSQSLFDTALALHARGHDIASIITDRALPEYSRREDDFRDLAEKVGASFILAGTLSTHKVAAALSGLDIGVSVNWGSLVRDDTIGLFRLGILNAHFADLPRYRGNACANWALINGEKRLAITIHFMEGGKLDCGRVVAKTYTDIDDATTIADAWRWFDRTLPGLYLETLDMLEKDSTCMLGYIEENDETGFRCYPRLPEDGLIDWTSPPEKVHNLVRALTEPFPGAYTYHRYEMRPRKLIVLESRVVEHSSRDLAVPGQVLTNNPISGETLVRCAQGSLALIRCRYEDEPEAFSPGRRFKSIRIRLNMAAEDLLWDILRETGTVSHRPAPFTHTERGG